MATNRFSTFSTSTAPVALGKQVVRFAPEMIKFIGENDCFPTGKDSRGDYLHIQLLLQNGATTASFRENKLEHNPKYLDNLKIYFDGKIAGDGYLMKLTFDEIRKMDKRYATMPAEEIFYDLMSKEFTVYLYRYEWKGKGYLQVAWSLDQYKKMTKKPEKKQAKAKTETAEEALPISI